ncbi:MAG: GNAT family N-acetyltransferase [Paludibacter sp.]|nr:GNAT family N-acetyltransferase [Paludibacter sp.]
MPVILRQIKSTDNALFAALISKEIREFDIDKPIIVYDDPVTDKLFELFQTDNSVYWVVEENGVILGGCGIFPTAGLQEGCAEIVKFYLSSESRGEGIEKLLMQVIINTARNLGYKQLYLESFPELKRSVGLYRGLGFKSLKKPLGNSSHHPSAIWFLKELRT